MPGVTFRDITPLLADPRGIPVIVAAICALEARDLGPVDLVAGSRRGFVLGAPAVDLGVRFVPCANRGKLPGDVHAETYDLEYGTATLEIQADAVAATTACLLVDDVLATGGTARAAGRRCCASTRRQPGRAVRHRRLPELERGAAGPRRAGLRAY